MPPANVSRRIMPDAYVRAAFYLSPTLHEWWRWEDDAQVLAWDDGRTIAFTPEVTQVIQRLAPGGLPPFGAVTLLLAACHDDWFSSGGRGDIIRRCDRLVVPSGNATPNTSRGATVTTALAGKRVSTEMKALLEGLNAVSRLPASLRGPIAAKALLAEVVFEASRNRGTPEDGQLIAGVMKDGLTPDLLRPQLTKQDRAADFAIQLREMAAGLARVNAEGLSRRLRTGLEASVTPPEKELSPPERVRKLLAELRSDDNLSGLAKLAHDLMAAVAVPRALRLREELQLGGVSDLTNRGPLDRLLISELAQDDLTLAVRVAINEAMYLRRESPPIEPPHHRAILIDVGVRMWGVPRIFATAVALALSAMADPAAALNVYRAAGDDAVPVELTTREGLLAHLSALETPPHPGAALSALADAAMSASDGGGSIDCFVITHADAANDADFLAAVGKLGLQSIYVGAVDRDGSFRLVARTRAGEKPIREAKLSLDEILSGRPKTPPIAVPLVDESANRDELPAIFFAEAFPLLLPYVADPNRAMTSRQNGLVAVTDDGRLLHWADARHGAKQLAQDLPRGQIRMLSINDDLEQVYALVVRGRDDTARLAVSDFDVKPRVLPLALSHPAPIAAFPRGLFVFLIYHGRVDAFDIRSGTRIATMELPGGAAHHRGRYFRVVGGFAVVAYDGSSTLKLEKLPTQTDPDVVFERDGHEGFWFVTQGKVADQSLKTVYPLPTHLPPHQLSDISPDGRLLLFQSAGAAYGKAYMVDLDAGAKVHETRTQYWPSRRLGPGLDFSLRSPVQLRKKFKSIGTDGVFPVLVAGRASRLLTCNHDQLELRAVEPNTPLVALRGFEQFHTKGTRIKLRIARWPDGSRAWLDNRGLLHLRSSDPAIPELSIALNDCRQPPANAPAAWSSEGDIIGPEYLVGDAPQTSANYFRDVLRRFAERLRS